MAYEDIQVALTNQPASSGMFGVKVRDSILDLDRRMSLVEAQSILPLAVRGAAPGAGGTNTIVSAIGTWANLPSNTWGLIQMTNPSAIFDMYCLVTFGAWIRSSVGSVRMGCVLSGGVVSGPDPGTNNLAGFGLMPLETQTNAASGASNQHSGTFSLVIPAGASTVTFVAQAQRSSSSGETNLNYPSIEVTPIRFQPAP